ADVFTFEGTQVKDVLGESELEALKAIPTPAIANAIELFDIRPRTSGYIGPEIQCRFPELGAIAGYAATAITTAVSPERRHVDPVDYWRHVQSVPSPTIPVFHDSDSPIVGAQ